MDRHPKPNALRVIATSCLLVAACSSAPLDLDAGLVEQPEALDLDSDGYELTAIDGLPDVDPPEDAVVARADMPEWLQRELAEEPVDKAVVGKVDSRVPIRNSQVAPYKAVVQVLTQWLKGAAAIPCTGTMVAPDAVLTAAHCLFDSTRTANGFPYSVAVVPGLYPRTPDTLTEYIAPLGVGYGKKLFVADGFRANERNSWNRIPFDYAIVRLKAPLAKAGIRAIGVREQLISQTTVLDA